MKIDIKQSIHSRNEEIAIKLNERLTEEKTFMVNVLGSPGAGKTTALIRITELLKARGLTSFVIEGDISSDIDTEKMRKLSIPACQINTGGACHLEPEQIEFALPGERYDFIFVENIGNLVCPAEFVVGEHIKLLISTVTEGSDKPYKYPLAFEKADLILVNKYDIARYLDFDGEYFETGIRKLGSNAVITGVSAITGDGFEGVVNEILSLREKVIK